MFNMDYLYHYWSYPMLFSGHCSCTCFTCLYKFDLLLLLIVIYLLLMDKITININTSSSTITTTRTRTNRLPDNNNLTVSSLNMSNVVSSTTDPILLSSSALSVSKLSSSLSSSSSSCLSKVRSSIINTTLPWDSMIIASEETLNNSERSTPSDPPESLPESLNSFGSFGSIRRKLIKPDISLDFLDSSSDEEEEESDNENNIKKIKEIDTDSLEECNVFSGCASDEHFYRDTSLSEETFTNDRITVKNVSLVPNL